MEEKYTVKELSEILNISVQATNKKVAKLEREGLKSTTEFINNRLTKVIYLTENQLNELKLNTVVYKPFKQSFNQVEQQVYEEVEQEVYDGNQQVYEPSVNPYNQQSMAEVIAEMVNKIEVLAREAGQVNLLTNNLMSSEQNVKFYQDEYFKIKHDLDNKDKELSDTKKENEEMRKELEALKRKKPFWKF